MPTYTLALCLIDMSMSIFYSCGEIAPSCKCHLQFHNQFFFIFLACSSFRFFPKVVDQTEPGPTVACNGLDNY